jgi:hypothetical protein
MPGLLILGAALLVACHDEEVVIVVAGRRQPATFREVTHEDDHDGHDAVPGGRGRVRAGIPDAVLGRGSGRGEDGGPDASPELVGQLVKDLGVTPAQAEGAAGALFGVAKTKLTAADFTKVASAVPNMDGLIKAAPAKDAKAGAMDALLGKTAASAGGVVAAAGALSKLGLKPETIVKLTPSLVKAVETKGGAESRACSRRAEVATRRPRSRARLPGVRRPSPTSEHRGRGAGLRAQGWTVKEHVVANTAA